MRNGAPHTQEGESSRQARCKESRLRSEVHGPGEYGYKDRIREARDGQGSGDDEGQQQRRMQLPSNTRIKTHAIRHNQRASEPSVIIKARFHLQRREARAPNGHMGRIVPRQRCGALCQGAHTCQGGKPCSGMPHLHIRERHWHLLHLRSLRACRQNSSTRIVTAGVDLWAAKWCCGLGAHIDCGNRSRSLPIAAHVLPG